MSFDEASFLKKKIALLEAELESLRLVSEKKNDYIKELEAISSYFPRPIAVNAKDEKRDNEIEELARTLANDLELCGAGSTIYTHMLDQKATTKGVLVGTLIRELARLGLGIEDEIEVDNATLMDAIGTKTLRVLGNARDELVAEKVISYEKQGTRSPGKYKFMLD